MSSRQGVLSRLRHSVERGKGGKLSLAWCGVLLKDPCVYCGERGCDTIDHIVPYFRRSELMEGRTIHGWDNFAPAHQACNSARKARSIMWNKLGV